MEGGPSRFTPGFSCLALLGITIRSPSTFGYGAITHSGGTFQDLCLADGFLTPAPHCDVMARIPRHRLQNTRRFSSSRFRLFPVRSPLLRKSRFLSLPEVTEMFQFTSFASTVYVFNCGFRGIAPDRFRIRASRGRSLVGDSPWLYAAVPRPSSPLSGG